MENSQRWICRKCLLKDLPEKNYLRNMYTYIANLSEDDKVSDKEYECRLMKCRECVQLINGMCRICGCFVEMRAVIAVRHCPDNDPKW